MIVISYGVGKSGSTLAFQMARAVLELTGHPQARLADGLVNTGHRRINTLREWTDDRLRGLIEATRGTRIVIKTHGGPDRLSTGTIFHALETGELKIHVAYRDPRDTVLSMIDHGARSRARGKGPFLRAVDVESALTVLRRGLRNLRHWGSFPSLKLCYDDFAFDHARGPKLIAEDLGMTADPEAVWARVDRAGTKKNRAVPHRWSVEMSPADAALVEAAVPNFLRLVEHGDVSWFHRVG